MLAVFEHVNADKLPFLLKEVKRVLRKNGIFVMTTPSPWSNYVLKIMSRLSLVSKTEIEDHKHTLNSKKIKEYIREAGFDGKNIKNGFFEAYFNMWFKVNK